MDISSMYSLAKALHLIGMVSWMAGVFYLVRIMVNHAEAHHKPEPDRGVLIRQYAIMEWKAYRIIIQPAVVITWSFGTTLLCLQPVWLEQGWMHGKLLLVVLFSIYTHYCKGQIRLLESANGGTDVSKVPHHAFYRGLNEVPTIILVGAVFLAVFKSNINWIYLIVGISLFSGLIFYAIRRVLLNARRG